MKSTKKKIWKRVCSMILAATLVLTMVPTDAKAGTSSDLGNGTFSNPVIYADVPDIDIIRVGDAYYMVSTTMHLSPGCPIMKSTDLVNWEIVNYVYDILGTEDAMSLRNGKSMYGNGQWASSLQYHDGKYYVAFNSNTTGKAYIFTTDDIEHGSWTKTALDKPYHDMALFFDDNGKVYIVYGNTEIKYVEMKPDLTGEMDGGAKGTLFSSNAEGEKTNQNGYILGYEGTHIVKKDGYYYVFNICWPNGSPRTEVCHRSKTFPGTEWENEIILKANFSNNGVSGGVAQGGIIDTADGKWYGFMFQDHGAVGRVPVLTDCTWKDGWPMLGKDGDGKTVEEVMNLPITGDTEKTLVKSDEFYNDAEHRVFEAAAGTEVTAELNAPAEDTNGFGADANLVQLFTNGDVEAGNTDGWMVTPGESDGAAFAAEENVEGANGSYALHVTERKSTGAGACQNISGKLKSGKTYTISGRLKYTTGPDTKQFYVTIQNGKDYNYRENLIPIKATKGEWVDFSETYKVHDKSDAYPFDETKNYIFIETPWTANPTAENDMMDYYLDDFSMTTTADNIILNGSFENGLENWTGFEGGKIEAVTTDAQDGTSSIVTKERTACAQGPAQDLSNKLTAGSVYTLTAYVKYDTGVDSKTFNATIQNGPDWKYRTVMGSVTAKKGEWTKLEVKYTMPEDAITDQNYLFFETPWAQSPTAENDLMDFYVDNVSLVEEILDEKETAVSGENDYNGSDLDLVWQWNHNPNNKNWSLTERSGWLRLTTGNKVSGILEARNTLTQRTYGPTCSGKIKMDISNMKVGDVAGLASFSYNYGYIAARKDSDGTKLIMVDASANSKNQKDDPQVIATAECTGNIVYLKEEFNFAGDSNGANKDTVSFYYSFDGSNWIKLGKTVQLSYELTHFMGSRFAIFNYATKSVGGYVDYDYFRVSDEITGENQSSGSAMAATMSGAEEVSGVINTEYEVKMMLDELAGGSHVSLKASVSIPDNMQVEDVAFNESAIKGEAKFSYKKNRLILTVTGEDVSFAAEDKLFATLKLKVKNYVDEDQTVSIKADYVTVDNGKAEYDVSGCEVSTVLKYLNTKALAKKLGYGNPIMTQEFGADPYAIEYNGRVYVYMTADDYQYDENGNVIDNNFGYIKSLRVVSSDDMLNWTDHGSIQVAGEDGAAKWASHSWAPAIAYNKVDGKDKFFLYFANDASGIGVLEADTPLGPWTDPIGKPLITGATPGCAGVVWCFDPAVLVDDDGSAYIYFGGGVPEGEQLNPKTARVAKLGADMVSIDGEAKLIDAPCMFEDGGIFKNNGKYYYSYCSNFTSPHGDGYPGFGTICYMVSDDPMGPYEYAGEIFENPSIWFGVGGNNHHATFVFEGQTYFIYHAQTVSKALGITKGYRSTHIDHIEFNSDGTIKPIKGTYAGIAQLRDVNPYERIDAETIAWNAGIKTEDCKEEGKLYEAYNRNLTDLQDGDWTSVAQVNFGEKGAETFQVSAASNQGGSIEIRLDSPEGELIGTAEVSSTGADTKYQLITTNVTNVTGTRNVFLVFRGADKENIMNVDYYQFTEKAGGSSDGNDKDDNNGGNNGGNNGSNNEGSNGGNNGGDNSNHTENTDTLAKYVGAEFASGSLSYVVTVCTNEQKTAKVVGTKETLTSITIPATVKYEGMEFAVTAIDKNAFKNQKKATKATIGKNVEEIGSYAFYNNSKLAKITFKGTVVKSIGKNAFAKIKKTASFSMKKTFVTEDGLKFKVTKCDVKTKSVAVTGVKGTPASIKIPATVKYNGMTFKVTSIEKNAFKNQKKLKSITVGKNVKTIGKDAFKNIKKNAVFQAKGKKSVLKGLLKKANTKNYTVK